MTQIEFIKKIVTNGHDGNANVFNDFLATDPKCNNFISETTKYYFKPFRIVDEIRYHKASGRVSVSHTATNQKLLISTL